MFFSSSAQAEPITEIWSKDRQQHAAVSAVLAGSAYLLLRSQDAGKWESLTTSVAISVLFGMAKETIDRQVDPGDIKADFVGAIAASGVFFTIDVVAF